MRRSLVVCLFVFLNFYLKGENQDSTIVSLPQTKILNGIDNVTDTVGWIDQKIHTEKQLSLFKPNPNKAVLYSAIFPGLGQIYNRKYWKLPIVYGGFLGLAYAISWNGRFYSDYLTAYRGISQENFMDHRSDWQDLVPKGMNPDDLSKADIQYLQQSFRRQKDYYRRYRDLSIIGAVALYGLCMIDAYVDAQLFDFDISPDLSLRVEPTLMQPDPFSRKSFGLQCSFKF